MPIQIKRAKTKKKVFIYKSIEMCNIHTDLHGMNIVLSKKK